ncbi:MAG: VOC family protein [Anaeromyxobacteraceae bacterium]
MTPLDPNFVLLYVADPLASGAFYEELLGRKPVESSPTFVTFPLREGQMLGLWSRHTVEPSPAGGPGSVELCFKVPAPAQVRATHEAWRARGIRIAQAPTRMDFGDTFVALDPDGHRLRVYHPAPEQA